VPLISKRAGRPPKVEKSEPLSFHYEKVISLQKSTETPFREFPLFFEFEFVLKLMF
jgi:hypothetical protein